MGTLLELVRLVIRLVGELTPLPLDWKDEALVLDWLRRSADERDELLAKLIVLIVSRLDDSKGPMAVDEWSPEEIREAVERCLAEEPPKGDKAGFDIATIVAIVMAILNIIKFWRDRRRED